MTKPTAQQLIKEIEQELYGVHDEVKDLGYQIKDLQSKAKQLEETLHLINSQLIPRVEYDLVKKVVFGAVGFILISVMTALIALVVTK